MSGAEAKRPRLCDGTDTEDHIPIAVIGDELMKDCKLTEFHVGTIKDRKSTSRVISSLNTLKPLDGFAHLKRVRNDKVLLCPRIKGVTDSNVKRELIAAGFDFETLLESDLSVTEVAAESPQLKRQYDIVNQLWPCNFHPDKSLEGLVGGTHFNKEEILKHRIYMKVAIQINDAGYGDGAVIVDPKIDSIVAIGFDRRTEHPCQHPVMVAIDNVAKTQGGGAWKDVNESSQSLMTILKEKFRTVKFSFRESIPNCIESPYLCTGYDLYTTKEPCIMCSMALVHARISNVFFLTPNPLNGGVLSKCKLHCVKGLNHHYNVFTGF